MSKKNAESFMNEVTTNEALRTNLKKHQAMADVLRIAKESGYAFSEEEYLAAVKDAKSRILGAKELSEEQLASVAGGAYNRGVKATECGPQLSPIETDKTICCPSDACTAPVLCAR